MFAKLAVLQFKKSSKVTKAISNTSNAKKFIIKVLVLGKKYISRSFISPIYIEK